MRPRLQGACGNVPACILSMGWFVGGLTPARYLGSRVLRLQLMVVCLMLLQVHRRAQRRVGRCYPQRPGKVAVVGDRGDVAIHMVAMECLDGGAQGVCTFSLAAGIGIKGQHNSGLPSMHCDKKTLAIRAKFPCHDTCLHMCVGQ